ncbi:MAG: hypothetical protein IAE80_14565, partial [Anaerolinea sp.]|nr:hypothetical protein [Anaerolinea sp.]
LLETTTFPVNESPLDGLERLGLVVRRSLTTDFDADGRDEWLVWLATPVYPVLFAPANDQYVVSRPTIDSYAEESTIALEVRELPDEAGAMVVWLRNWNWLIVSPPWGSVYDPWGGMGGGGYGEGCREGQVHELWLWRFEGGELHSEPLRVCGDSLDAVLSADGRTIDTGVWTQYDFDTGEVIPGTERRELWVWDAAQGWYVRPPVSGTATPLPTIVPPTLEPPSEYDAQAAWRSEDYAEYIAITDVLLPTLTDNPEQVFGLRYRRGLAFELLGQPEQALAEYQAIYDQALGVYDDWAALAAIHLPE